MFCITSCRAHTEVLAIVQTCGLLSTRPQSYFQQICCMSQTGQPEPLQGSCCPVWDMQHIFARLMLSCLGHAAYNYVQGSCCPVWDMQHIFAGLMHAVLSGTCNIYLFHVTMEIHCIQVKTFTCWKSLSNRCV